MVRKNIIKVVVTAVVLVTIGCGGSSSSGTTNSSVDVSGIIVDPYIKGAVLCEDVNKNNSCDEDEQVSTASDVDGKFSFNNALTAGSNVIIKEQGTHNGVTYELNISGVVNSSGGIDIVSPLTTLQAKGLTTSQITTALSNAGLKDVAEATILIDPMSGGLKDKTLDSLNDSDLVNLHANLATYGLLRVMDGSKRLRELNGIELNTAILPNGALNQILTAMVTNITTVLSKTNLQTIDTTIKLAQQYSSAIPDVKLEVIIKTAVTILDRLTKIGYTTCNNTDGNDTTKVTTALSAVDGNKTAIINNAEKLGQIFYGKINSSALKSMSSYLPPYIQEGVNATKNTFIFDDNNTIIEY